MSVKTLNVTDGGYHTFILQRFRGVFLLSGEGYFFYSTFLISKILETAVDTYCIQKGYLLECRLRKHGLWEKKYLK